MQAEHPPSSRIMVVDDNPANVDALLDQLLSAGFEVAVAQDGEEALEQIQRRNRELALLTASSPPRPAKPSRRPSCRSLAAN